MVCSLFLPSFNAHAGESSASEFAFHGINKEAFLLNLQEAPRFIYVLMHTIEFMRTESEVNLEHVLKAFDFNIILCI